jgi:5-hydroxyisourate hydrolase-like protein (transthyretin family)
VRQGIYRLVLDVADYFKGSDLTLPEPNFLNSVSLDCRVSNVEKHYHGALLIDLSNHARAELPSRSGMA